MQPTNLNTGQSASPNISSLEPSDKPTRPIDIPWTELPEDPKPDEEEGFNPNRKEPEYNFNPNRKPATGFNPSNKPLQPWQIPTEQDRLTALDGAAAVRLNLGNF